MTTPTKLHAGIVGAGVISSKYIQTIQTHFPILQIEQICANHLENAQKRASEFSLEACTFEEMLQNERIDLIINLTPAYAHYDIIKRSLLAGKHVYSEKTLTDSPETARELACLAAEKKLYLGCAPDTFLGSALQTARKAIDDGLIGEVTSFSASVNRNNSILLSLFSFLRMPGGGLCYDYGVYYVTAIVSLLGAVDKVAAFVHAPYQTHRNILPQSPDFGKEMKTPNESQVATILHMKSGISGTLMLNADSVMADQAKFMIYGTKGILFLTDPNQFGGDVMLLEESPNGQEAASPRKLSPVNSYSTESRGIGAADLAESVLSERVPRASAELGIHVLDVLSCILESGKSGTFMRVPSDCERPAPL